MEQFVLPALEDVPVGHGKHSSFTSKVPAGHAWQLVLPASETVPAGQLVQLVEPVTSEKVPAGHRGQLEEPATSEYDPAGQRVQFVESARENEPAGQFKH